MWLMNFDVVAWIMTEIVSDGERIEFAERIHLDGKDVLGAWELTQVKLVSKWIEGRPAHKLISSDS